MRYLSPVLPIRIMACVSLAALAIFAPVSRAVHAQQQQQPAQPANFTLTDDQVLNHLNSVITWYRHSKTQIQSNGLPTDAVYQANAEAFAGEAVRYAFASAEAASPLVATGNNQSTASSTQQRLLKARSDTATRVSQLQKQISDLTSKIASTPKSKAQPLMDQRDRLQGEIDLGQSMLKTLDQLTKTTTLKNQGGATFSASVAQLKTSVPELFDSKAKEATTSATASPSIGDSGLIAKLHRLYTLSVTLREIDTLNAETTQVRGIIAGLRTPMRNAMQATIQQGRSMSSSADNPQAGQAAPTRQDFDALAAKFDQLSTIEVPLSQEALVIDQASANLADWRASIATESGQYLRDIILRVAIILGILGLLFLVSDIWKRVTFRYVSDPRRRRQFLLVRRVVIGFMIGLVLILSFVSEFSALATFAGFITAGLAVGLQTVLLSVAAYFFLIGRYGLRVGDRISVAGVTGDVVDVGFVRFYLLELDGTGIDLQPTGRIVAFSNAVLFQATSPMYKQAPGTEYAWHEIAVPVNPAGDMAMVEKQMLQAVNDVYEKYRPSLEQQRSAIERRFEVPITPAHPKALLQFSDAGLEAVVRYPVSFRGSIDADDQITRNLVEMISKDEALKASVAGLPKIRAAVRA